MKQEDNKIRTVDIRALLLARFGDTRKYAFAQEVGNATGTDQTRRIVVRSGDESVRKFWLADDVPFPEIYDVVRITLRYKKGEEGDDIHTISKWRSEKMTVDHF